MILILGADHLGYSARIKSATLALSDKPEITELDVKICQIVRFVKNGQPVKMSKRKGTFETLSDVLDEIAPDILRFTMLTKKNDMQMDFDFEKNKEQTKDNPIFYIQYAYARCFSLIKNFNQDFIDADISLLCNEHEIEIIKKILEFPKIVENSAKIHEPHHIAFYLYDLSSLLHSYWNAGNENQSLRFIAKDNHELTKARLYLVNAFMRVVANGLEIFGIKPLNQL